MQLSNFISGARNLWWKTALPIVLLTAAVNAHATSSYVILPTGNFSCSAGGYDCSDVAGDSQLPDVGGIAGVSFYTLPDEEISITTAGPVAYMSAGGTLNQPLDGPVPVKLGFYAIVHGRRYHRHLGSGIFLGTGPEDSSYGAFNAGPDAGPGTFSGSGDIDLSEEITGTLYETIFFQFITGSGTMVLTAPFDFGSPATTPEPASLGSLGAGLGFLTWLYRRRKNG